MINKIKTRENNAFAEPHNVYLLGIDENGTRYWLQEASWDCDWYWGLGYVETYTSNNPMTAHNINSHQHFNRLFFDWNKLYGSYNSIIDMADMFRNTFNETPLNESEIWQLLELMKSAYAARDYANMLHMGGAHITTNPVKDTIKNDDEYNRINKEVIPAIMEKVYALLTP